jgi:tetratricopeptide (TPR) repeat protein
MALLIIIGASAPVWGQATSGSDKKDSDKKDAAKKDTPEARAVSAPDDPAALPAGKDKLKSDRKSRDPFADEAPDKGSPAAKSAAKGADDSFATPAKGKLDGKTDSKEPVDPFAPIPKKDDAKPVRTDPFGSDLNDSKTPSKTPDAEPSKRGPDSDNPFEDKGEPSKSPDTKMPADTKTPEKSTRAPADLLSDTKSTEPEPTPGSAELKKGQELIDAGKYSDAIDPLKKAIKLAPTEAGPPYTLGVAYRMLDRYDDAIEEFSEAIKLDSELGDAYLRRGVCWYNKGEFALAQADFEDAHATAANINDPRPLTWKGMTLVRLGHVREAANVYSEALRNDNHYAPAHINRGLAYVALKEYEKAIADFDEAIRSTPKDASLYFKRGVAQSGSGDWPGAVQSYSEAIRINPKYADAYNNRSLAYRRIGDGNKAQADAAKSQELKSATDRAGQSAAR